MSISCLANYPTIDIRLPLGNDSADELVYRPIDSAVDNSVGNRIDNLVDDSKKVVVNSNVCLLGISGKATVTAMIVKQGKLQYRDMAVEDLLVGDYIYTGLNNYGKIDTITRQRVSEMKMYEIKSEDHPDNPLWISPWHPVYYENEWKYPSEIAEYSCYKEFNSGYLYNFYVSGCDKFKVNGIYVMSMCNYVDTPKFYHPFFNTDKIINSLDKIVYSREYSESAQKTYRALGIIDITGYTYKYERGNICGFIKIG
jgi:hypothetical protein